MSVDMLFLDKPLYGQSMWHCLQFIEKVTKGYQTFIILNIQEFTICTN